MNFPGNYEHIGRIDPARLKQLVLELSEDQWQAFSVRQKHDEVHRETQTIGRAYDPDLRHSHATRLPTLGIFESALRPALAKAAAHYEQRPARLELVKQYGPGYFVRATLVRLPAGCRIAEHQDLNFSLTHSHRIHLPVVANESVFSPSVARRESWRRANSSRSTIDACAQLRTGGARTAFTSFSISPCPASSAVAAGSAIATPCAVREPVWKRTASESRAPATLKADRRDNGFG